MFWAQGHGAATPCPTVRSAAASGSMWCSACVPLPPSGFLRLLSPWEEVQLIGCRRRRVTLIPQDSSTWRGGATRTPQPAMTIDMTEVSGENGLDLLSSSSSSSSPPADDDDDDGVQFTEFTKLRTRGCSKLTHESLSETWIMKFSSVNSCFLNECLVLNEMKSPSRLSGH